jgi:hypothetical protein
VLSGGGGGVWRGAAADELVPPVRDILLLLLLLLLLRLSWSAVARGRLTDEHKPVALCVNGLVTSGGGSGGV